jgi:phytol kinase
VPTALHDPALALVSIPAIGALVALVLRAGRAAHLTPQVQRHWLHAAVGTATIAIVPMFREQGWALAPPLAFLVVNATPRGRAWLSPLASIGQGARGLWAFPLGVALTMLLYWDETDRSAVLAGVAALAYADPMAAIVGKRWGQRRLAPLVHGRTLEGSLAFFAVAALSTAAVAWITGSGVYQWRMGIGCGLAGMAAEALSPSGWDNVAIPVVVAATFRLLA